MFTTLQRRKACERCLTVIVVASLLLSLLPTPALAFIAAAPTLYTDQHSAMTAAAE